MSICCLLQSTVREVEQFLSSQGLNARVVVEGANKATDVAKDAATTAQPVVQSTLSRISVTEPGVLAQYGLGLAVLYFLVSLGEHIPLQCSLQPDMCLRRCSGHVQCLQCL